MKDTRTIMGMPVTIDVADPSARSGTLEEIFAYFVYVDEKFSTYKEGSEISRINRGEIAPANYSDDMKLVFLLAEQTKKDTKGYFDIRTPDGKIDPLGLVKGWAINNAAAILRRHAYKNFYVDVGGDVQADGCNEAGMPWSIGIRDPFDSVHEKVIKVVYLTDKGIATSGTYLRGQHIYDPFTPSTPIDEVVSLTVIGPNVYEADRFATAAFAMRKEGIHFIEQLEGFEGYSIDATGIATKTAGFDAYTKDYADHR